MVAIGMAMTAVEAVEMQKIDKCSVAFDDANGTIARLAFGTENNRVDFL